MTDPRDSNRGTVVLPDTRVRGRFLWHELMTSDTQSAADFYTRVVGWTLQSWDQNPSYQMFLAAGVPMSGMMTMPEEAKLAGAPPGWLGYIGSTDVDATTRLAVKLGGKLLKDTIEVSSVGRFSILQDPYGAVFSAFTPEQDPIGDDKPGLGDFSWHELATKNVEGAFAYYQELFGWKKTDAMDMGPGLGIYQMFGTGELTLGGIYRLSPTATYPSAWLPYALVKSSDRAAALIPTLGGTVINGPMDVPGGDEIVQLLDPQGGMFAVHSKGTAKGAQPAVASASKSVAGETARPRKATGSPAGRRTGSARQRVGAARIKSATGRKKTAARTKAATVRKKSVARTKKAVKRSVKRGTVRLEARVRGRALKAKVRRVKRRVVRKVRRTARRWRG